MKTYVAWTTTGGNERSIIAIGTNQEQVRERAEQYICGDQWDRAKDIYVATRLKNLRVIPRSQAIRSRLLRNALEEYEHFATDRAYDDAALGAIEEE